MYALRLTNRAKLGTMTKSPAAFFFFCVVQEQFRMKAAAVYLWNISMEEAFKV